MIILCISLGQKHLILFCFPQGSFQSIINWLHTKNQQIGKCFSVQKKEQRRWRTRCGHRSEWERFCLQNNLQTGKPTNLPRHFPCEQQSSTQTCLYYFKEETERITLNSFQESCEDLKKISNSSAGSSFSGDWFSNLFNKVSNNRCQTALIINFF